MGAFILNSMINSNLDNLVEHQLVKNVVYMAAAANIQNTVQTNSHSKRLTEHHEALNRRHMENSMMVGSGIQILVPEK